jgi:hypothetical protein
MAGFSRRIGAEPSEAVIMAAVAPPRRRVCGSREVGYSMKCRPSTKLWFQIMGSRSRRGCASAFAVMCVFLPVVGCGELYYLPGHNEQNAASPPSVTMHVGERRLALRNGLNVLDMPPPDLDLRTDDPHIVSVETPDKSSAYLKAVSLGATRVYYMPPDVKVDRGFKVTVVP